MFYKHQAIRPTPGLAFEAFDRRYANPMMAQQAYRPEAAGPEFLSTDGLGRVYMQQERSRNPQGLRGLGDDISSILSGNVQGVIQDAIVASWPTIQAKLDAEMKPLKYMLGAILVISLAGATFAYLASSKK